MKMIRNTLFTILYFLISVPVLAQHPDEAVIRNLENERTGGHIEERHTPATSTDVF
jgi:hypothetical protein